MKQFIKHTPYLVSLLILLGITSCTKMDEYLKYTDGKEILYTGIPDSIAMYSGYNRVVFRGVLASDPKIAKTRSATPSAAAAPFPLRRRSSPRTGRQDWTAASPLRSGKTWTPSCGWRPGTRPWTRNSTAIMTSGAVTLTPPPWIWRGTTRSWPVWRTASALRWRTPENSTGTASTASWSPTLPTASVCWKRKRPKSCTGCSARRSGTCRPSGGCWCSAPIRSLNGALESRRAKSASSTTA